MNTENIDSRRPLKSRGKWGTLRLARFLAAREIRPNQISLFSIVCALFSALLIALGSSTQNIPLQIIAFIFAALGIQLRLLCNLIDGMVAVECNLRSSDGEMFNDLPDRISDVLLFVASGYALALTQTLCSFGPSLGWIAAILALSSAYVRVLGASIGTPHFFLGPMAKQQRMAALSLGCLLSAVEAFLGWPRLSLALVLLLIIAGTFLTIIRRTAKIVAFLNTGD